MAMTIENVAICLTVLNYQISEISIKMEQLLKLNKHDQKPNNTSCQTVDAGAGFLAFDTQAIQRGLNLFVMYDPPMM
jgi:hypothetical protein